MKVTINSARPALISHAQGLLESYCREYAHDGRTVQRKAVLYCLRGVYSAAVWGNLEHVRITIKEDEDDA